MPAAANTPPSPALPQSYAAARAVTRHHARTFYFASWPLPTGKRAHAYAVYAFCRHLDDTVDNAPSPDEVPAILENLEAFTSRIFGEGPAEADLRAHPWLPAFLETSRECAIPERCFLDLLEGVRMDRDPVRIRDWPHLDRYCYHVAGVVGLMMTRVFGLRTDEHNEQAIELGRAMQLTNILRDVGEDLANNRIYLPADEMERFGISEEFLRRGRVTAGWREFMRFQIERARQSYTRAEEGIRALPRDGSQFTTWLMRVIYAEILTEIERAGYDIFTARRSVSFPKKCLLLLRCIGRQA